MEVKLCKDCKNVIPFRALKLGPFTLVKEDYGLARCRRLGEQRLDTGEVEYFPCQAARVAKCGPEGEFWEAKLVDTPKP